VHHETLDEFYKYNCEDCCRTFEIAEIERRLLKEMNLESPEQMQQSMVLPVLDAMIRGVRIDLSARAALAAELLDEMSKREAYFNFVLEHPLNPASSKQMQSLFYDDLKQGVILNRKTRKPTLDDDALTQLGQREPILKPLLKNIAEYRTLGVFLSTFVGASLDEDQRMRCSFNICGTETYRLSSRKNAFDSGTNLQNIPKLKKSVDPEDLVLPNIRKLFIPDPGYTFFDGDLDRADLQVVVWEINDTDLKLALRLGIDMHCMNACSVFNIKGIDYHELTETHPNYKEHRGRIGELRRHQAKEGVHATNYGGKGRAVSVVLGTTVHEADKFIEGWLNAHPNIRDWHTRTNVQLQKHRFVENRFGYRRFYFDRPEGLLPEALAWVPQSTVAITINKIWFKVYNEIKEAQILLQIHDSIAGQIPSNSLQRVVKEIEKAAASIVIPYDDPLVIPFSVKTSARSWGECK
jgi:DNA polymerase I-like protein with 3'-5' exonuclease and polymerase domains